MLAMVPIKKLLLNCIHKLKLVRTERLFITAASLYFFVKVARSFNISLQHWDTFKLQTEPFCEVLLDASDISLEVVLGIDVGGRCHLREVDDCDLFIVIYHQVELVEITMDKAVLCKLHDKLNQPMIDRLGFGKAFDVYHRVSVN